MGGCRCTYRSCKATTDGQLHFFHYPVWDKERCHKWILNAQRPEFLDLKISQLKNRVICQKHFTDDMFMNEMKKKLIHNAIPTDGVDKAKTIYMNETQEVDKPNINGQSQIVIGSDDSKFFTPRERKATLSFPYNQFLTKCNFDTINDPSLQKSLDNPKKKTPFLMPLLFPEPSSEKESQIQPSSKQKTQRNTANETKLVDSGTVVVLSHKMIKPPLVTPKPTDLKRVSPPFVLKKPKRIASVENPSQQVQEQRVSEPFFHDKEKTHSSVHSHTMKLPHISAVHTAHNIVAVQQNDKVTKNLCDVEKTPTQHTIKPPRIVSVHTVQSNDKIDENFYNIPVEFVPPPGSSVENLPTGGVTFVTPENVPIIINAQKEDSLTVDPSKVNEVQENMQLAPVQSKHHRLSMYKQKHSCRRPRKIRSLSAALLAKVNENSKDIAEIKQMMQQRFKKKPKHSDDYDLRKEYLFDEISQYLSTRLKNEIFQELFVNTEDHASGKRT